MRVTLLTSCRRARACWLLRFPHPGHHAFAAEFDANKPIKLRGTVAKMEWINPAHVDPHRRQEAERQRRTLGDRRRSTECVFRRGFSRDSLPTGIEIVVEGFQAKDGSRKGNGRDLTFADGKRLFLGSSGTGAPRDGRDTNRAAALT